MTEQIKEAVAEIVNPIPAPKKKEGMISKLTLPIFGAYPKGKEAEVNGAYIISHPGSGKMYVGSTKSLRTRKIANEGALNRNTHRNPGLQAAFNADPVIHFAAKPTVTRQEAYDVEQSVIDVHAETGVLFNVAMNARNPGSGLASPEIIEAVRQSNLGAVRTTEQRQRMSSAAMGKIITEETKQKMRDAAAKRTKSVMADGKSFPTISAAARAHGLVPSTARHRIKHQTLFPEWTFAD